MFLAHDLLKFFGILFSESGPDILAQEHYHGKGDKGNA